LASPTGFEPVLPA